MGCGSSTAAKSPSGGAAPAKAPTPTGGAAKTVSKFNREAMLKQVFSKMDADGDGTVDVEEMKRTAKSAKEAEELPLLFHFFDQNADGKLTYDEWVVGINQIAPDDASLERELKDILQVLEGGAMAATMDANAENPADDLDNMDDLDAMIAAEDDSGNSALVAKAKAIFEALDTDGSGSLSKSELAAGLVADKDFGKLLVEAGTSSDPAEAMKALDLDGDDEVSWLEFEMVVTSAAAAK